MSKLQKLDSWLLEAVFQRLVDASQKRPAWWVEHCAYALLVTGLLLGYLGDGPMWWRCAIVG